MPIMTYKDENGCISEKNNCDLPAIAPIICIIDKQIGAHTN